MTKVRYDREGYTLRLCGHAGAGEKGADLICAAVSTLAHTLEAALTDGDSRIKLYRPVIEKHPEKAEIRIRCQPDARAKASCLVAFDTVAAGLKALAEQYPKYVSFRRVKR